MVKVSGGYHRKATYSWRICSELQHVETKFSAGRYRTLLWCHFGTCMALLCTEESALWHTGQYRYQRQRHLLGVAKEEIVTSWWRKLSPSSLLRTAEAFYFFKLFVHLCIMSGFVLLGDKLPVGRNHNLNLETVSGTSTQRFLHFKDSSLYSLSSHQTEQPLVWSGLALLSVECRSFESWSQVISNCCLFSPFDKYYFISVLFKI